MTQELHTTSARRPLLRDAAITLALVLFAFAAFDDITTDNDTSFWFEWLVLAVCAFGLAIVSRRLLLSNHRWLGTISAVVLAAGVVAGSTIRRGVGPFEVEYLTTLAGMLWFLALAAILTGQSWRRVDQRAP